jgi:hypothetical protein
MAAKFNDIIEKEAVKEQDLAPKESIRSSCAAL